MQASRVTGRILAGDAMNDHNTFEDPDNVVPTPFDGVSLSGSTLMVDLPARSVVGLELQ